MPSQRSIYLALHVAKGRDHASRVTDASYLLKRLIICRVIN